MGAFLQNPRTQDESQSRNLEKVMSLFKSSPIYEANLPKHLKSFVSCENNFRHNEQEFCGGKPQSQVFFARG
jgi:hypothetical protein